MPYTMPSTGNTVTKKANKICSPGTYNLERNTDIWSTLSPPTQWATRQMNPTELTGREKMTSREKYRKRHDWKQCNPKHLT